MHRSLRSLRRLREFEEFQEQANCVKRFGLVVASLQKLSSVVGIIALAWATAVVLGVLIKEMSPLDFYFISSLTLLQSLRLFVTEMLAKVISFIRQSDRARFSFIVRQPDVHSRLSRVGSALGTLFDIICLIGTIFRFCSISNYPFDSHKHDNGNKDLILFIHICYILVLINSALSFLSFVLHDVGLLWIRRISSETLDNSLLTFYDSIYKTAMDKSMTKAKDLQLLEFGFCKIVEELKRNIGAHQVEILNRKMLSFMYFEGGIEMASARIKSHDIYIVAAAANLPGFWRERRARTLQDLFWMLRDHLYGSGKDAVGALNSVTSLARHWSTEDDLSQVHPFLIANPSDRGNVLDSIIHLVLLPSRLKVPLRIEALEACCRDHRVRDHLYDETVRAAAARISKREISGLIQRCLQDEQWVLRGKPGDGYSNFPLAKLCSKLARLVLSGPHVELNIKIYSAKALLSLLLHGDDSLNEEFKNWWTEIIRSEITLANAQNTGYFVRDDVEAAEQVLNLLGLPALEWSTVRVIDFTDARGGRFIPEVEVNHIVNHARKQYISSISAVFLRSNMPFPEEEAV